MPFTNPLRDPDGNPVPPIVILVATKKHAEAIVKALETATPEGAAMMAGILADLADAQPATNGTS